MNYCLSISESEPQKRIQLTESESFVEMRCDLMGVSPEEVGGLVASAERALVTCHSGECREAIYSRAIEVGAWGVDLADDLPEEVLGRLTRKAKSQGVKVILSHHYDTTPTHEELLHTAKRALMMGADIAKIITTAHTTAEALAPLALYEHFERGRLIAFAMGERGRFTRRLSLLLGAPYTYIAPSAESTTALGQPTREWLDRSFECPCELGGGELPDRITPPASKSEAQRAILLATLAEGQTVLTDYTPCNDNEAAVALARRLGAEVAHKDNTLTINGVGAQGVRQALSHPTTLLVGESALLARLTLPLVALLSEGEVIISGTGTLLGRTMQGDLEALTASGTPHKSEGARLPITVGKTTKPLTTLELDGSHSSQTISGWMIALGTVGGDYLLRVRGAVSRPYTELTAGMMRQFGVEVKIEEKADIQTISIHSAGYTPRPTLALTGDWSGAGYWAAGYAIAQSGARTTERRMLHIATSTTQADEQILAILRSAGAQIATTDYGVEFLPSGRLQGFSYDATDAPDLIPTLAVVALFAEGRSQIGGLGRLASKESDRCEALVEALVAMGAKVAIEGDWLTIEGGARLHSAPIRTHNDHRMVMAMAICALFVEGGLRVDDVSCVAKSYPTFFDIWKR